MRAISYLSEEQVARLKRGESLEVPYISTISIGCIIPLMQLYNKIYKKLDSMGDIDIYPDIIEFDVPEEYLMDDDLCELEWGFVISRLWLINKFNDCDFLSTSPSRCFRYVNEVICKSTYHLCYAKDIVFREIYSYDRAYFLSSKVVKSSNIMVIKVYIQSQVFEMFVQWLYSCKYNPNSVSKISVDEIVILFEEVGLEYIAYFNSMLSNKCIKYGYTVYPNDTVEEYRLNPQKYTKLSTRI